MSKGISSKKLKDAICLILKGADLEQTSSKKVRKQLEKQFDVDLTSRKNEVDDLIMEVINGHGSDGSSDDDSTVSSSDLETSPKPSPSKHKRPAPGRKSKTAPPKKRRSSANGAPQKEVFAEQTSSSGEDAASSPSRTQLSDAELARRLHAEENGMRARSRRRGADSEGAAKPKKRGGGGGGFSRPLVLSDELAEVVGADNLPRHEVVKKMWEIARERDLFDPKNKQFILCDEQLERLFKKKRLRMFGIMRDLKRHMWKEDE